MLGDILLFPVTGPIRLIVFVADKVAQQVESQKESEETLLSRLFELQFQKEAGAISQSEYEKAEAQILNRLNELREEELAGEPE